MPAARAGAAVKHSFKSASDAKKNATLVFDIDGEEFTAHPGRIPGTHLFDFVTVDKDSKAMWEVFEAALGEDFERFRDYVRSPEHPVEADTMGEIIEMLFEAVTGRPTTPSSS